MVNNSDIGTGGVETKQSIQVKVCDTDFALRTDGDPDQVRQVAAYVDAKIRSLSESTSVKSPMKIAVLAALNIAEELFNMKKEYYQLLQNLEKVEARSKELSDQIEHQLSSFKEMEK
ncbi:MAG: cell division protein ZapA [Calditrichaeota bacterium]|nr:MAG: cell division protein ZapA [Calditrichota bacterium]